MYKIQIMMSIGITAKFLHFETNFIKLRFLESYFSHQNDNCVNEKQNGYFPAIYNDFK